MSVLAIACVAFAQILLGLCSIQFWKIWWGEALWVGGQGLLLSLTFYYHT